MDDQFRGGMLFKQINDALEKRINNDMRDAELTMAQMRVLIMLEQREDHVASMKDVEHTLGVAQSTCAGILSRLCAKGMVETYCPPEDRRSKLVRLTDRGKQRCDLAADVAQSADAQMAADFTPEEKAELLRLLDKVLQNIK